MKDKKRTILYHEKTDMIEIKPGFLDNTVSILPKEIFLNLCSDYAINKLINFSKDFDNFAHNYLEEVVDGEIIEDTKEPA